MQAEQPAYALKRELRHNTKLRPKDTRRIRASQAVRPASRKACTGYFLWPGDRGRVSLLSNQSLLENEFEYKIGQPYIGLARHVHKEHASASCVVCLAQVSSHYDNVEKKFYVDSCSSPAEATEECPIARHNTCHKAQVASMAAGVRYNNLTFF